MTLYLGLYRTKRNFVTLLIRDAKSKYFQTLLSKSSPNSHQYWRAFDSATRQKLISTAPLPVSVEELANHFSSVVSPMMLSIFETIVDPS